MGCCAYCVRKNRDCFCDSIAIGIHTFDEEQPDHGNGLVALKSESSSWLQTNSEWDRGRIVPWRETKRKDLLQHVLVRSALRIKKSLGIREEAFFSVIMGLGGIWNRVVQGGSFILQFLLHTTCKSYWNRTHFLISVRHCIFDWWNREYPAIRCESGTNWSCAFSRTHAIVPLFVVLCTTRSLSTSLWICAVHSLRVRVYHYALV